MSIKRKQHIGLRIQISGRWGVKPFWRSHTHKLVHMPIFVNSKNITYFIWLYYVKCNSCFVFLVCLDFSLIILPIKISSSWSAVLYIVIS